MLVLTVFLVRRTALGLFIESVGDNYEASRYSGINARQVKFLVYTFSGLCAGLAGLVACSNIKSADANNIGLYLELDAILAVVVGGTSLQGGRFYFVGAVVGALFIQTLTTTLYARNVSSDVSPVPKALVIIAVCLFQSDVFRSRAARLFRPLTNFSNRLVRDYRISFLPLRGMMRLNPKYIPLLATAAVLILVFGTGSLLYPNFGTPRVIVNLLGDQAFVGVAAVGESFVIFSGGIDLSVGSMVAFVGILIARLLQDGCDPVPGDGNCAWYRDHGRSFHGLPDPLFRNASFSGHSCRPLLFARPRLCHSP